MSDLVPPTDAAPLEVLCAQQGIVTTYVSGLPADSRERDVRLTFLGDVERRIQQQIDDEAMARTLQAEEDSRAAETMHAKPTPQAMEEEEEEEEEEKADPGVHHPDEQMSDEAYARLLGRATPPVLRRQPLSGLSSRRARMLSDLLQWHRIRLSDDTTMDDLEQVALAALGVMRVLHPGMSLSTNVHVASPPPFLTSYASRECHLVYRSCLRELRFTGLYFV